LAGLSRIRPLEEWLQLGLLLLLVVGCWLVLRPFFTAILFSAVIAISTWPLYRWMQRRIGRVPASVLGCLAVTLLIVGPVALLSTAMADGVGWLVETTRQWYGSGAPEPPAWLQRIPWIGDDLQNYWRRLVSSSRELRQLLDRFSEPLRNLALTAGRALGGGLLQVLLAIFLLFFMYRDGERLAAWLVRGMRRIVGEPAERLLATAQHTIVGVMLGVLGTALAQAMVAIIGFTIAGVPGPFLLGALTFVGSMIPIGPPLVWGGATLWLVNQGEPGWALFMLLYGLLVISAVDNVIKPFLISRSSRLPFALTLIGVVGGVLTFGVMGVFIGPMLLALAISLGGSWLAMAPTARPRSSPTVPPTVPATVAAAAADPPG